MFPRRDGKGSSELPEELARLDRRLRGIAIEERCSFGVELRAKLEEEHSRIKSREECCSPRRRSLSPRLAVAAAAGALFFGSVGLAVPSARAALANLLLERFRADDPGSGEVLSEPPLLAAFDDPVEPASPGEEVVLPPRPDPLDLPRVPISVPATLPGLLDPDGARRTVADQYPDYLQRAGVGGRVRVLAWVNSDGTADHLRVSESSGVAALDRAARSAAGAFRFRPAMRGAQPVGAWVEFSIRFRPSRIGTEQPDPESRALRIPLSN